MCPHKSLFINFQPISSGKVLMGNDIACQMMGIGSVKLRLHDGRVRELTDVRYVPDLKRNLISLGTLDQNGCSIRIDGGILRVLRGSMVVMR